MQRLNVDKRIAPMAVKRYAARILAISVIYGDYRP